MAETGTFVPYDLTFEKFFKTEYHIDGDSDLFIMFTSSSHTPNRATHEFQDDLTNIVSGTGLPAAGIELTGATITLDGTILTFDIDDISEPNVTATGIRNVHLVDKTPDDPEENLLLAYGTLSGDLSPVDGNLTITIHANGAFRVDLNPS